MKRRLLTVLLCILLLPKLSIGQVNTQDRQALLAFYHATEGASWKIKWDLSKPINSWHGITLNRDGSRVKGIKLTDNNLQGQIPEAVSKLTELVLLDLGDNNLSGSIPSALGLLTKLEVLKIYRNDLNGEIPEAFGNLKNLRSMSLGGNQLSGDIPSAFGKLKNVRNLFLDDNQLTGIPEALCEMTNLRKVKLRKNNLQGTLPLGLGKLQRLVTFNVSKNPLLTGPLPFSVVNLKEITFFEIHETSVCEPQHPIISDWASSFYVFSGSDIRCEGIGSAESDSLTLVSLYHLTNGKNWKTKWDLTKPVKDWHGVYLNSKGNVIRLIIPNNNLKGQVPIEISMLSELKVLALSKNQLSGQISQDIGYLQQLERLQLHFNQLSGGIPSSLGRLNKLEVIGLKNNRLQGALPYEISALTNLRILDIQNNPELSGQIPAAFAELDNLEDLHFSNTNICQPNEIVFQTWIKGIPTVRASSVSCDEISGTALDRRILTTFYQQFKDNPRQYLYWNLEQSMDTWQGITTNAEGRVTGIELEYYEIRSNFPNEFARLNKLETLDLSDNFFEGSISDEFKNMSNLRYMDVSWNKLYGQIPSLPESLIHLDLAFNNLTGNIPTTLGDLTNLNTLRLRNNNLQGPLPQELILLTELTSINLLDYFGQPIPFCKPDNEAFAAWENGISYSDLNRIPFCNELTTPPVNVSRVSKQTSIEERSFELAQNYPNPTNSSTTISFYLTKASNQTRFVVFDAMGKIVYDQTTSLPAGSHKMDFSVANWPVGVYSYALITDQDKAIKKLVVKK